VLVFFCIIILNFNQKIFLDQNGGFIIRNIVADSKRLTVASIYTLNENDPNFFQLFFNQEIIFGGDFNLVLKVEKDKRGGLA